MVKLYTIPGVHAVTTYTLVPRDLTPTTRNHVVTALSRGYVAGHPAGSVTHAVISALSNGLGQKFERRFAMPVYGYASEHSTREYPIAEVCWPYGMIRLVEPELDDLRKELAVTYRLLKAKAKGSGIPVRKQFVPDLNVAEALTCGRFAGLKPDAPRLLAFVELMVKRADPSFRHDMRLMKDVILNGEAVPYLVRHKVNPPTAKPAKKGKK
jgi:hypothetical protein